ATNEFRNSSSQTPERTSCSRDRASHRRHVWLIGASESDRLSSGIVGAAGDPSCMPTPNGAAQCLVQSPSGCSLHGRVLIGTPAGRIWNPTAPCITLWHAGLPADVGLRATTAKGCTQHSRGGCLLVVSFSLRIPSLNAP